MVTGIVITKIVRFSILLDVGKTLEPDFLFFSRRTDTTFGHLVVRRKFLSVFYCCLTRPNRCVFAKCFLCIINDYCEMEIYEESLCAQGLEMSRTFNGI